MEWNDLVEKLFKAAEPYLAARGDREHTRNAYENALYLLDREGGDSRIVVPAIILHDVGWSAVDPERINDAYGIKAVSEEAKKLNRIHEIQGAEIARGILASMNYDPEAGDKIAGIIERHDSGTEAGTQEEKIVKDADKLWRFSKTGFWKEQKRQGLKPSEMIRHRAEHIGKWFFTAAAREKAEDELRKRAKEIPAE